MPAAKLSIFPFSRHLPIKKGKDAAANVVRLTVWVEAKVDDVGVEIVLEVEWVTRSKTMQQREKSFATGTCRKCAKKDEGGQADLSKRPKGEAPCK